MRFLTVGGRVRVDVDPLRRQIRDHGEDEQADRGGAVDGDATCVRTHAGPVRLRRRVVVAASSAAAENSAMAARRNAIAAYGTEWIRSTHGCYLAVPVAKRLQPVEFHFRGTRPFDFVELDVLDDAEPERRVRTV